MTNLHVYLVRVTARRGSTTRRWVRCEPRALLDHVTYSPEDRVEIKGWPDAAPRFPFFVGRQKVAEFLTRDQWASYQAGYNGYEHVQTQDMEDFYHQGRHDAEQAAAEREYDRAAERQEREERY